MTTLRPRLYPRASRNYLGAKITYCLSEAMVIWCLMVTFQLIVFNECACVFETLTDGFCLQYLRLSSKPRFFSWVELVFSRCAFISSVTIFGFSVFIYSPWNSPTAWQSSYVPSRRRFKDIFGFCKLSVYLRASSFVIYVRILIRACTRPLEPRRIPAQMYAKHPTKLLS